MKKISILMMCVMLMAALFTGCTQEVETTETDIGQQTTENVAVESANEEKTAEATVYPLTIVDGEDREVVLEKEPMRIVSLAPSVTETLYAVGAGDKLVGRTDYCLYPQETTEVPSVGTIREPNVESIVALEPDVVIVASLFKEEVLIQLEALDIKVFVLKAQESFEGVYETTLNAGLITNHKADAEAVIDSMRADVKLVTDVLDGVEAKSVYYVVGFGESDYTATGDTFINDMLTMAGGDNIAKDGEHWVYSLEKLVEHNPEVVLVSDKYDSLAGFSTHENYQVLDAVKEGRVLEIDSDLLSIQGPRIAQGLKAIAELLHPELF
ncbi:MULTISPECIES: ABC transporter substrate-binding protein [unclassified Fusibacter]|uniref:ABC transporter substrate-binding protein n=1 Tax=unclassified Fusibacter TaxID=2624464 RepID=UPI0010109210|nr:MULTISPECIES: ABC transporter substrate-binding protein [unclassified Fusibacter]MCK8059274.1 ABC transporter substrate-binding protein [Fusibacter sp. A2]NPE21262.1 ABC transporter substrate-binding protein [Fusibacter sp. A1]RXV62527.1 ABC transporter substrate-binding protein [Fusibacter sp. A1]